jgi:hypothetical protein
MDAEDEKPLQLFFEENPVALLFGLVSPHTGWVIPRPRLSLPEGGGNIPDFIVCEWSSVGPRWIIVELESPKASPVNEGGGISTLQSRCGADQPVQNIPPQ